MKIFDRWDKNFSNSVLIVLLFATFAIPMLWMNIDKVFHWLLSR